MKHIRTVLTMICLLMGLVSSCSSRVSSLDEEEFLGIYEQAFDKYFQINFYSPIITFALEAD